MTTCTMNISYTTYFKYNLIHDMPETNEAVKGLFNIFRKDKRQT